MSLFVVAVTCDVCRLLHGFTLLLRWMKKKISSGCVFFHTLVRQQRKAEGARHPLEADVLTGSPKEACQLEDNSLLF